MARLEKPSKGLMMLGSDAGWERGDRRGADDSPWSRPGTCAAVEGVAEIGDGFVLHVGVDRPPLVALAE